MSTELVRRSYLHFNPVRRGLIQRPKDWEWSSARRVCFKGFGTGRSND
jgi:hypothetical protein